jgi:hypothetical protein
MLEMLHRLVCAQVSFLWIHNGNDANYGLLVGFRDADHILPKRRVDTLATFHDQPICSAILPSSFSMNPLNKSILYTLTAQTRPPRHGIIKPGKPMKITLTLLDKIHTLNVTQDIVEDAGQCRIAIRQGQSGGTR